MTFPTNSAFTPPMVTVKVNPKQKTATAKVGVTTIYTADIEDLEYDLRELAYAATGPEDARVFEELANKVASFYKG